MRHAHEPEHPWRPEDLGTVWAPPPTPDIASRISRTVHAEETRHADHASAKVAEEHPEIYLG